MSSAQDGEDGGRHWEHPGFLLSSQAWQSMVWGSTDQRTLAFWVLWAQSLILTILHLHQFHKKQLINQPLLTMTTHPSSPLRVVLNWVLYKLLPTHSLSTWFHPMGSFRSTMNYSSVSVRNPQFSNFSQSRHLFTIKSWMEGGNIQQKSLVAASWESVTSWKPHAGGHPKFLSWFHRERKAFQRLFKTP